MKILKAIGSIFNPKKLAKMVNFSFLLGLLLLFVLVFASFGSANITSKNYVIDSLSGKYFVDYESNTFEKVSGNDLLKVTLNNIDSYERHLAFSPNTNYDNYIVQSQYKNSNTNELVNITFLYELDYIDSEKDMKKLHNEEFLTNYLKETDNKDTLDILVLLTKTNVYMLLNHGYLYEDGEYVYNYLSFENQNKENKEENLHEIYDYYLPSYNGDKERHENTVNKGDSNEYGEAYPYLKDIKSVFYQVIPSLDYFEFTNSSYSITKSDPMEEVLELSKYYVDFWINDTKLVNTCRAAFPYHILLPILLILVTWLISRNKGVLKSFKEYFNLFIFTFIPVCLIDFIVGFFIPYSKFVIFSAIIASVYYCIMAFIINSKDQDNSLTEEKTLEVKDVKETDHTLTIDEIREEASRIG